jgi:hypothetical protein
VRKKLAKNPQNYDYKFQSHSWLGRSWLGRLLRGVIPGSVAPGLVAPGLVAPALVGVPANAVDIYHCHCLMPQNQINKSLSLSDAAKLYQSVNVSV